MDVVSFNFSNLPDDTRQHIRVTARKSYGYTRSTPVEQWFTSFCQDVIITRIAGDTFPKSNYIVDYKFTMPKEKYVEFCLRWL